MEDKITQEFGFDVSQALRSLDQLDKKLAQVDTTMSRFATTAKQFNRTNIDRHMQSTARATAEATEQVDRFSKRYTASMETLSRVVYTQAIVRALSSIRNELYAAAEGAKAYQKAVAEIQTIGGGIDTGNIVRDISDDKAFELQDTAKAYYNTLSNAIAVADSQAFMADSADLARAGVSNLNDSVNLLSGTLNAYGKQADQAADLGGKFFRTVQLGRTTITEMSRDLGGVIPLASQLNVNLEELLAAYSAITIGGVKSNIATTQLKGTLSGMLKPTEAMEKALKKLGFTNAEQLIGTYGFNEGLQKLIGTTDRTAASIAELFPNIRGLAGSMSLTAAGAAKAASNLEQINKAGADLVRQKAGQVLATDALKAEKAWNAVSNAIKIEFGGALLKTNRQLFDLVGGSETAIELGRRAVPIIEAGGLALGVFALQAAKAKVATAGWASALKTLPGFLLGAGVAYSAGDYLGDYLASGSKALADLEKSNDAALKSFERSERARLQAARAADAEMVRSTRQANQSQLFEYQQKVDRLKASHDDLVKNTKDAMSKLVKARQTAVKELERAATQSANAIVASQDRVNGLSLTLDDQRFDRSIRGETDDWKARKSLDRAEKLARQAQSALSQATTTTEIDRALDLFKRAQQLSQKAESLDPTSRRAGEVVDKVIRQQIAAEKQLQANMEAVEKSYRNRAVSETKVLETLKAQAAVIGKEMAPRLQAQLDQSFSDYKLSLQFDTSGLEKALGEVFASPEQIFQGLERTLARNDQSRIQAADYREAQKEIQTLQTEIQQLTRDSESFTASFLTGFNLGGPLGSGLKALELFREQMDQPVSEQGLQRMQELLGVVEKVRDAGWIDNPGLAMQEKAYLGILERLHQIHQLQQVAAPEPAPYASMQDSLSQSEQRAAGIAANLERAANAAVRMTVDPINRASGGMAYFAAGGRGIDSIPAMLAPGEFVVNPRSSARFFSQLQAINAGQRPVYRDSGGPTYNTSIGDIHVAGGDSPQMTGRQIGAELRREIRRGLLKL